MTDIIEPLGMIAEFSIGLAGFTGIIAALFANRATPIVHFRFVNLLLTSFAPGFFALFTIAALYTGLPVETAMRLFSAALILYIIAWGAYVSRKLPVLAETDGGVNQRITRAFKTVAMGNVLLQLLNTLVAPASAAGIYILGLILLLLTGAVQFGTLALGIFTEQVEEPPPVPASRDVACQQQPGDS